MFIKTIEDMHKCNLELLLEFDTFCKDNDIHYYLCGGTLLGAIRDRDFIPWDDDLDVSMFREDYEKLCSIPEYKYPDSLKFIGCGENNIFYDFIPRIVTLRHEGVRKKICDADYHLMEHPFIDIFIIDYSHGGKKHKLHVLAQQLIYALARGHRTGNYKDIVNISASKSNLDKIGWIARPIRCIGKRISLKKEIRVYETLSKKCKQSDTVYFSNGAPQGLYKEYKSSWFDGTTDVEIRGHTFPAPSGYDDIQKVLYGDYMKLPPAEFRVPYHFILDTTENENGCTE